MRKILTTFCACIMALGTVFLLWCEVIQNPDSSEKENTPQKETSEVKKTEKTEKTEQKKKEENNTKKKESSKKEEKTRKNATEGEKKKGKEEKVEKSDFVEKTSEKKEEKKIEEKTVEEQKGEQTEEQKEEKTEENTVEPIILKSSNQNPEKAFQKKKENDSSKEEKSEEKTTKTTKDYSENKRLSSWETYTNEYFGFSVKNTSTYDKVIVLKKVEKDKNGDDNYILDVYSFVPVKFWNFTLIDETAARKTAKKLWYSNETIVLIKSSCVSKTHCADDIWGGEREKNKKGYSIGYLEGIQEGLYEDQRTFLTESEQEELDQQYYNRYAEHENSYVETSENDEEMNRKIEEVENMNISEEEKEARIDEIFDEYHFWDGVNMDDDPEFTGNEEFYQKKYQENGYKDEEDYEQQKYAIMKQITNFEINDQL